MLNVRDPYAILQVHQKAVPEVIEAAYRTLARLHHPDRTDDPDADTAMADLNWAYAVLREPSLRASYDNAQVAIAVDAPSATEDAADPEADPAHPTLSERVASAAEAAIGRDTSNPGNTVLDFGRFAGMTLRQIARQEPSYLEWLRRHSSGVRYRHQIDKVLESLAGVRPATAEEG